MGLFRRSVPPASEPTSAELAAETAREIERLRATVDELRRELALRVDGESREIRDELESMRSSIVDELAQERTNRADEVSAVVARLDPLVDDLGDARTRLDAIDERFSRPLTDPPAPPTTTDPAALAALGDHVDELAERIAAVDARLTATSTELANQLTELGGDIEAISARQAETADTAPVDPADTVDPETLDELRAAQERLANEQARYQIAFRQDLAQLAEDLRRRSGR